MEEQIFEAREELKRVEHIIFVSLKYTRTTDVLRNGLLRLVNYYDTLVKGYLMYAEEKGLIEKIPKSPALCSKTLASLYPDDKKIQQHVEFYFFLKDLLKKPFGKINEYRRHVGMVYKFEEKSVVVNIDHLEAVDWYANRFFEHSLRFLGLVKKEEDD